MKNKRLLIRKYLPIFLVLVCLSGCVKSHRPISERLLKAEKMMDCHQTGAYQLLTTLQPEVIDWSEEQQMRYWTDYVDAKNKDIYHLDESDLKRLEELLSYHQKKRNGDEVVRVLYLLGSAKRDTGQMSDAIELWLQGAYSSDGQPKTKALIYEQLTSAYYYRFLFDEGRTFNDSALHYARMTGDSAMIADVLVDRCALFQFQQFHGLQDVSR